LFVTHVERERFHIVEQGFANLPISAVSAEVKFAVWATSLLNNDATARRCLAGRGTLATAAAQVRLPSLWF